MSESKATVTLLLPAPPVPITLPLDALPRWLRARGWVAQPVDSPAQNWQFWERRDTSGVIDAMVSLPLHGDWTDYQKHLADSIVEIAAIEQREPTALAADLLAIDAPPAPSPPHPSTLSQTIPHVWDVDGRPRGVRHSLTLSADGQTLTARDEGVEADGRGLEVGAEEATMPFVEAVHLLLNATEEERRAIGGERTQRPDGPPVQWEHLSPSYRAAAIADVTELAEVARATTAHLRAEGEEAETVLRQEGKAAALEALGALPARLDALAPLLAAAAQWRALPAWLRGITLAYLDEGIAVFRGGEKRARTPEGRERCGGTARGLDLLGALGRAAL